MIRNYTIGFLLFALSGTIILMMMQSGKLKSATTRANQAEAANTTLAQSLATLTFEKEKLDTLLLHREKSIRQSEQTHQATQRRIENAQNDCLDLVIPADIYKLLQ